MASALIECYKRLPVSFVKGEGVWLWDEQGNKYLDALSGIAVCGLGHAHPDVTAAITEQSAKLIHCSNLFTIPEQEKLAQKLAHISQLHQAFFCNSGAEANEAAIKFARLYGHSNNVQYPQILVMDNSFHGRTLATLSATGNRKIQAGFEPLVQGFVRAPFDDINALRTIASNNPNIVAVLFEPIQGEGGVVLPTADYLHALTEIAQDNDWLMICDEVQTGMGRTGQWFAHQHFQLQPDIVTMAKGLGNGVPIGACLVNKRVSQMIKPGSHGSTFGGNPLVSAVACSVLESIEKNHLLEQAQKHGETLLALFQSELADVDYVHEIRGLGLMIGIELNIPCPSLVEAAIAKGIILNVTQNKVIRLLPPLIINEEELEQLAKTVISLVRELQ